MAHRYPTHPDYRKTPVITLRFNRLLIALMNTLMRLVRWLQLRNSAADLSTEKLAIPSSSGPAIKALYMRQRTLQEPAPLLVYFHGGAFALTYGALHVQLCERYAREAGCAVLFVDYRLMPANRWPKGFDDCYDSLRWALREAGRLGIDPARVAVGGDSAGGALAAGVAQKAHDDGVSICGQMLVYPTLDSSCSTQSVREFTDTPLWNGVSTVRMWQAYLGDADCESPPAYAAPGLRQHLPGLVPAYIETAEFDPLRDEGLRYAENLGAAGVPVQLNQTSGTIHGYEMASSNPVALESIKKRVTFLQACFSNTVA